MSLAGVRSNRGDAYQTLIALDWAISMINDPELAALEVDSTLLGATASPVQVDDVVVHFAGGRKTYCQCKKNEPDFKAWAVGTLGQEIAKAARLLHADPAGRAGFYSASPFGELAKLREYAVSQADLAAYKHGLPQELSVAHTALEALFESSQVPREFVFEFLLRTTFESISFERLETTQHTRLSMFVSSEQRAYEALWSAFDRLGARIPSTSIATASTHLLSREDVIRIVESAGSVVTPPRAVAEIESALEKLSQVGRNWRREIRGMRLTRKATGTITDAVRSGTRSILLTSGPGAGKTCTLLDAFDEIGNSALRHAVFVQCRSLAEAASAEERAALGYPRDFVGSIARLAERAPVVVFFDSLDVLSLSREHGALTFYLSQIDQLLAASNVAVVAASRAFDAKYDARLSNRNWELSIDLGQLDWQSEVAPLLHDWRVDEKALEPQTKALLTNPRNLAVFSDMLLRGFVAIGKTQQDLTREYLYVCVRSDPALGDAAMNGLEQIAQEMLSRRSMEVARERIALSVELEKALQSAAVIQITATSKIEFTHQTLLDVLSITASERRGGTLSTFVLSLQPVPFVRPAIRAYVLYLAGVDRSALRKHLRAIVSSGAPHHIKRVVVETLADVVPQAADWSVVSWLRQYTSLFDALFARTSTIEWHRFWLAHLMPESVANCDAARLLTLAQKAGDFIETDPGGTLSFWSSMLDIGWLESSHLAMSIEFRLSEYASKSTVSLDPLLNKLLALPAREHDSLGSALMRSAAVGQSSDDLLWRYIAGEVDEESLLSYAHERKIRCDPHVFGEKEALANRMRVSDRLLSLAVDDVERWHAIIAQRYSAGAVWIDGFLRSTSYVTAHNKHDISHVSDENVLFGAIEAGILERARQGSPWWTSNSVRLARSREGAFRFWAVRALTENPQLDTSLAAELGSSESMLSSSLRFETGEMLHQTMLHMSEDQQTRICEAIAALPIEPERFSDYLLREKAQLALAVPAHLRTAPLQKAIEDTKRRLGVLIRQPHIDSTGGSVRAPFGYERFLASRDSSLLELLQHYATPGSSTRDWGELIGGSDEVGHQLREAASRAPVRFLNLLINAWSDIPVLFREDLLAGAKTYLSYLHGGLQYDRERWKPCQSPNPGLLANMILDEIERHPAWWDRKRVTADALEAVSHVLALDQAERFAFQLMSFLTAENPHPSGNLLTTAINSARGNAADAAMVLTTRLLEARASVPDLLLNAARRFAADPNEPVRAVMLRRLAYLTSNYPELGWDLFVRCTADASPALWRMAEHCLYYAYHRQFAIVSEVLDRILEAVNNSGEDPEALADDDGTAWTTWARISALASLAGHIPFDRLIEELSVMDRAEAWLGATSVWIANAHLPEHRRYCMEGLLDALQSPTAMLQTAKTMERIFDSGAAAPLIVSFDLVDRMFGALRSSAAERRNYHPHWFVTWIAEVSKLDAELALASLERLSQFLAETDQSLYDHRADIPRALTELFREAEERELVDGGALLRRLIDVQDRLLTIGVHGIDEWLKAAERP